MGAAINWRNASSGSAAAGVGRLPLGLLRRHVRRRAQYLSRLRPLVGRLPGGAIIGRLARLRTDGANGQRLRRMVFVLDLPAGQICGKAPVHDLDLAEAPHHDVGWFQVAVDDAPAVGKADRLAHLQERLQQQRSVGAL